MGLLDALKDLNEKDSGDTVEIKDSGVVSAVSIEKEDDPVKDVVQDVTENHDEHVEEEPDTDETAPVEDEHKQKAQSGYEKRKSREYKEQLDKMQADMEAARKREDQLQAALLEITRGNMQQQQPQKQEEQVPNREIDPDAWMEYQLTQGQQGLKEIRDEIENLKRDRIINSAKSQLRAQEEAYKATRPDYFDAINYGFEREIAKAKRFNPNVNELALREQLEVAKVELAAKFHGMGRNAVDELYNYMIDSYGYTPKDTVLSNKKTESGNFDAVRKNKAKSASSLAAGGSTNDGNVYSPEAARTMSIAEFSKLTPDQKKSIYG